MLLDCIACSAARPGLGNCRSCNAAERGARRPQSGVRPLVWRGILYVTAEHDCGVATPARIEQHGACEGDEIGLTLGDDRLRLLRVGDQPDGPRGDARLALHLCG